VWCKKGWRLGKRKPGIVPDGEGLVEAAGESIEVQGVGLCRGVGFAAGEGDGASVIDLSDKALRDERVGFREGGSSYVGEGGGSAFCNVMRCRVGTSSEESSLGLGEVRWGFCFSVPVSRHFCSQGCFGLPFFLSWARARRLRIGGGGGLWSVVWVEARGGKD